MMTQISFTGSQANPESLMQMHDTMADVAYPPCLSAAREHMLNSILNLYYALISASPTTADSYMQISSSETNLFQQELNKALPNMGGS